MKTMKPLNRILILAPRWSTRDILVADWKIASQNLIDISYAPESGIRAYPLPFYITGQKARSYPIEKIRTSKGEVPMRVIPLNDLDLYIEEVDEDTPDLFNLVDNEGTDDHMDVTDPKEPVGWDNEA